MSNPDCEELAELIARHAFRRGRFRLASGRESDYYVDLGLLMKQPRALYLMVQSLLPFTEGVRRVGGPSSGADMLVAGLLLHSHDQWFFSSDSAPPSVGGFLVKKPREGGTLEGVIEPGDRCLVIEDVTTTGGSALTACRHVREQGGVVACVASVLDRQEGAEEAFRQERITFVPCLTLSDILDRV